jgi:hypothetical protein
LIEQEIVERQRILAVSLEGIGHDCGYR